MFKVTAVLFFILILFMSVAIAENVPSSAFFEEPTSRISGDNPPTPLFEYTGQCDLVFAGATMGESGSFDLTTLPDDATIIAAYFITGIWYEDNLDSYSMAFNFNGTDFGVVDADTYDEAIEDGLGLGGFSHDVTAEVTGNSSYSFSAVGIEGNIGPYGHMLTVVYTSESLPFRALQLLSGAESLQFDSSTASFDVVGDGQGMLHIFTEADQPEASDGEESIRFNGSLIAGGPGSDLFASNGGDFFSYFELPVTVQSGSNSVTITTGEDWFGWHFAALVGPPGAVETRHSTWDQLKSYFR